MSKQIETISKNPYRVIYTYEKYFLGNQLQYQRILKEQGKSNIIIENKIFENYTNNIIGWLKEDTLKIFRKGRLKQELIWEMSDSNLYDTCLIDEYLDSCDSLYYIIKHKEYNDNGDLILEGLFKAEFDNFEPHEITQIDIGYDYDWIIWCKKYDTSGNIIKELKEEDIDKL